VSTSGSSPVDSAAAVKAWSRPDLTPVGQPVSVAGVAVGYVTDNTDLYLVGIDPATGNTLWKQNASPGEVTPGIGISPSVVGDKVAYLRPDSAGNLYARLVVADPRSGEDVASTPALLFDSLPLACSNHVDVCTASRASYNDTAQLHRLRVASDQYVAENPGVPPGARNIGESGLLDLAIRNPEMMGLVRDGHLIWKRNLSDAFPAGFSTDHGWTWTLYPAPHIYAGSVYGPTSGSTTAGFHDDLAATDASAGLSETDGTVMWRDPGSAVNCRGTLEAHADPTNQNSPTIPVRCRYHGTETWPPGTDHTPTFTSLDVTLEGFDPATGKTTWSLPAGTAAALTGAGQHPAIAGTGKVIVAAGGGPEIVDLTTGSHQKPAAAATFWCPTPYHFTYREPWYRPDHSTDNTRNGGDLGAICDANGKPATATPSIAATRTFGTDVGTYAIIATANGLIGYHTKA
jgi:outer membrane protein assembly factor BamB